MSTAIAVTMLMLNRMINEQDKLRDVVYQLRQDVVVLQALIDTRAKHAK